VYTPLGRPEPEIEKGDWDPWAHAPTSRHAHEGFYLRLALGVGAGGLAGDNHIRGRHDPREIHKIDLSSGGFGTSIAIGGAIVENLILDADLFHATIFNPSVQVDGRGAGDANKLNPDLGDIGVGEDFELIGLGGGVTYYFMPINLYLAGSVGLGQVAFVDSRGNRAGSDVGLGVNFMVGKEWWVAMDWGIGVAGQLIVVRTSDDVLGGVSALAANLMFTATYN
jgi:hypothetical protein